MWYSNIYFFSSTWLENKPFNKCANPDLPHYQKVTIQLLAYVAIHTFALRLIYPGTLSIIQNMLCKLTELIFNIMFYKIES